MFSVIVKWFLPLDSAPRNDGRGKMVCLAGQYLSLSLFFFLSFVFCLFMAAPRAFGGSQARGLIGAVVADLHQSHSNPGSEPCLMAMPDP